MERQQNYLKKPGRKKKPRPNAQQQKFVETLLETNDTDHAKEVAGYSPETDPMKSEKVQVLYHDMLDVMRKEFQSRAYDMMIGMAELAQNARSEHVKYLATKDMLDRAGLAPINKSEIETRKVISSDQRITRELIDRVNKLKEIE